MNADDKHLQRYYKERAPVYDRVYAYPERQEDLRVLERYVAAYFAGKRVIEIAAGTGYWTRFISEAAKAILATDTAPEALCQIEARNTQCLVETRVADAYTMDGIEGHFDAAFAGLWFSHIAIERRGEWLAVLHDHLGSGARVLLLDNSRAQCARLPISRTDGRGNTYQIREADSGERFEVMKNFPTEFELLELTARSGREPSFQAMNHFWTFAYKTR